MTQMAFYLQTLQALPEWENYLLAESNLPGPRGNLELAYAAAQLGSREQFERWLAMDGPQAQPNQPGEFVVFCGVLGLGKLLAQGDLTQLSRLKQYACDTRWRTREAVAMALQTWGKTDMDALLQAMADWAHGSPYEQRAAAAALCEPCLLSKPEQVLRVLSILDAITAAIPSITLRKSESFQALKKGLAYCWSVAAAALPEQGKLAMQKWFASSDKDIRWIMKENLKKNRLIKIDPEWVEKWTHQLA
jgi:hypothetical protein